MALNPNAIFNINTPDQAQAATLANQAQQISNRQNQFKLGRMPIEAQQADTMFQQGKQLNDYKLQSAQLENLDRNIDVRAKMLQSATPDNWQAMRQQAITQLGEDPNSIPEQYDPAFVRQSMMATMSMKDQLANQINALKAQSEIGLNTAKAQTTGAEAAKYGAEARKAGAEANMYEMFNPQPAAQPAAQGGTVASLAGAQEQPTGESFLQRLSPAMQASVKAIAEGRMSPPSGMAMRSPMGQALIGAVTQYDPSFDATNYQSRNALRKDYTAGNTKNNIVALNTAMSHIDTMGEMAKKLENGSIKPANAVMNMAKDMFGNAAPQEYQTAKTAVASELGKYFRGSGMSDAAAAEWEKAFESANSPQQMDGVVKTAINLIAGRANELQDTWKKGMGQQSGNFQIIDNHASDVLKKYGYVYQDGHIYTAQKPAQQNLQSLKDKYGLQ